MESTKIKITYENEQELKPVLEALKRILPTAKLHKSDVYKPYLHAYLTTKKSEKADK